MHGVGLQFQDYPWGLHDEVKDTNAAPVERYLNSWRFLILVELAKLILTQTKKKKHQPPDDKLAREAATTLEEFIRENWGAVGFAVRDVFTKTEYRFEFAPQAAGFGLGTGKREKVGRRQLAGFLVEANRWMELCLEELIDPDQYYFVLFDQLDLGYDPGDAEYANRLIGLLLAARQVFHWSETLGRQCISPTVFLRSDIYDRLDFSDKNKLTRNLVETLTWSDALDGENSLKVLIDQRIRAITGEDSEDPWATVFDSELMRGSQHKF